MSLNNIITRTAVSAPPYPPAISLGVSLPLLFILSVAGTLYMVYHRRKEQRKKEEAQRKEVEERDIALRKLGGSEVWEGRSASDGGSERGAVEGEVGNHGEHGHLEEVRIV
jgi:hypothetical protein